MVGDSPLPFATRASLVEAFTESDLPYKVDIVDWALTSESFRNRIKVSYVPLQNAHEPTLRRSAFSMLVQEEG